MFRACKGNVFWRYDKGNNQKRLKNNLADSRKMPTFAVDAK
jgi:hypothetical protein